PVIFVMQNNGFAISVPFSKEYAVEYAAQRAAGYGFPGVTLDGRDPVTAYHVAKQAVARARAGEGPTLIECLVDRLGAHSSEDDQRRYRTQEELDQLAANDGLERFRRRLLQEGVLDELAVQEHEERVRQEVTEATRQGMASPDAPPASGPWPRCSSWTSPTWPSTRSRTRSPGSATGPTATGARRWSSGGRWAATCMARCTTPSRSRRASPRPGSRSSSRRRPRRRR